MSNVNKRALFDKQIYEERLSISFGVLIIKASFRSALDTRCYGAKTFSAMCEFQIRVHEIKRSQNKTITYLNVCFVGSQLEVNNSLADLIHVSSKDMLKLMRRLVIK